MRPISALRGASRCCGIPGVRLTPQGLRALILSASRNPPSPLSKEIKLSHPTRQLITIAALTVLGRPDELKLHIQAALNVGLPARRYCRNNLSDSRLRGPSDH
jgi:hypothetical protein